MLVTNNEKGESFLSATKMNSLSSGYGGGWYPKLLKKSDTEGRGGGGGGGGWGDEIYK